MLLVDRESGRGYVEVNENEHDRKHKEYASKSVAGTALGLSIGALGLQLLGANGGLLNLGRNNSLETAAIESNSNNEKYIERKQCADYIAITEKYYNGQLAQERQRFNDRNQLNQELFNIYKTSRDGFDVLTAKHNADSFALYKYSRDSKDELSKEIGDLKTELAVLKATRPYQDALIQCDIHRTADNANFNLWRRTCNMIEGQVVLPNTPVIEGYGSYNRPGCNCNR